MGVQFWWFYDVIVVAVALVLIFITVKRGFMKATATAVGYILAVFISFSVSGGLADSIADTALKGSKIKDLTFTLAENDYAAELTVQINSLKYYAPADQRVIQDIYSTGENVDNNIYSSSKDYEPQAVKLGSNTEGVTMDGSSIITGFSGSPTSGSVSNSSDIIHRRKVA